MTGELMDTSDITSIYLEVSQKVYYVAQTPEGKFKRYAYRLIDSAKVPSKNVLIQYIGDEKMVHMVTHEMARSIIAHVQENVP